MLEAILVTHLIGQVGTTAYLLKQKNKQLDGAKAPEVARWLYATLLGLCWVSIVPGVVGARIFDNGRSLR